MSDNRDLDWLLSQDFAHRGLHSPQVPENSRRAAEAAIEARLGIECDIQMSLDNVPMVFHDWELERLTNQRGKLSARTAADLARIPLLGSADTIWTLEDFLSCIAARVPVLIEIKSLPHLDIAVACTAIGRVLSNYRGPFAVMSFDPRVGEWFARNAPAMIRGLVTTDTYDHGYLSEWRRPRAIERAKPDFLASDIRDVPNAIAAVWREAGHPLLAWTIRNPELRAIGEAHCDALIAEGAGLS